MDFLTKIILYIKKPKIIVVLGRGKDTAAEAIYHSLKPLFKVVKVMGKKPSLSDALRREVIISDISNLAPFILVATHTGEYHPEKEFFAGNFEETALARELAKSLPSKAYCLVNYDDETVREISDLTKARVLTFGLGARADLRASDISITGSPGVNFKINYQGKIIPVWLKNTFGREQIYAALAAAACGLALDLNLLEVSSGLSSYRSLQGKMQFIRGIKNSWVLDDADSATVFSMIEALEILKRIESKRKIAVLGDVIGIGKYTIEAHEAIGEKVAGSADLLFTVGPRAKFIAQGAVVKGMPIDNIFQFDTAKEAAKILQNKIEEGDIVLVDGSKEMKMSEIVEEIKYLE